MSQGKCSLTNGFILYRGKYFMGFLIILADWVIGIILKVRIRGRRPKALIIVFNINELMLLIAKI
tara:strand:- start:2038 stop:2232 length:195 start_codon:yes stop_codon:yes gene_type:complete